MHTQAKASEVLVSATAGTTTAMLAAPFAASSASPEVRARAGVSVYSSNLSGYGSRDSSAKENAVPPSQVCNYYSGEYHLVPQTKTSGAAATSKVQRFKVKSSSVHSSQGGSTTRTNDASGRSCRNCKIPIKRAEEEASSVLGASTKFKQARDIAIGSPKSQSVPNSIITKPFVRPFVAGTESSAERRLVKDGDCAKVALEYYHS